MKEARADPLGLLDFSGKNPPPSSYAKNRGDLLNKVLNPLKKLVRKRLGKELPLRCEGKAHEFKLLLEPSELSIGRVVGLRR